MTLYSFCLGQSGSARYLGAQNSRRGRNADVDSVSAIESDPVDTKIDAEKTTLFIVQSGALGVESPSI